MPQPESDPPEEPVRCVFKEVGKSAQLIELAKVRRGVFAPIIGAERVRVAPFWRDERGEIAVIYDAEYIDKEKPKNVKDPSLKYGFHAFYGTLIFVRTNHKEEVITLTDDDARALLHRVNEFSL